MDKGWTPWGGTFDTPVRLAEFDTVDIPGPPRLTADELELYFTEHIGTADADLYRAQRSATSQPFGTPIALAQVNSTVADDNPSVTSDGLMLFFESTRLSGPVAKLFVSTRPSRVGEFGPPSEVANVNSTTVTDNDAQPFVTADGQELWFVSNRAGGLGARDIDRAVWSGSNSIFLLGKAAYRAHVRALAVLVRAHVEDEPRVLGEQAPLALGQATHKPRPLTDRPSRCNWVTSLGLHPMAVTLLSPPTMAGTGPTAIQSHSPAA